MTWDDSDCALPLDDDPLEHTARLPVLRAPPQYKRPPRVTKPGQALPLRGTALAEWQAWTAGEEEPVYACRRAVV